MLFNRYRVLHGKLEHVYETDSDLINGVSSGQYVDDLQRLRKEELDLVYPFPPDDPDNPQFLFCVELGVPESMKEMHGGNAVGRFLTVSLFDPPTKTKTPIVLSLVLPKTSEDEEVDKAACVLLFYQSLRFMRDEEAERVVTEEYEKIFDMLDLRPAIFTTLLLGRVDDPNTEYEDNVFFAAETFTELFACAMLDE